MPRYPIFIFVVLVYKPLHAELAIPGLKTQTFNQLAIQDKTLAKTGLASSQDDLITDPKLKLSEDQLHEAKVWELTEEEEKRYVLLMQNKSKTYYEGLRLTPIDILGLNARSELERNHFADLAAVQEAQKVSKNIAWNNAFHKAYKRLVANIPVIGDFDPSPYSPYAHKPVNLTSGDTLYLFIKEKSAVKTILMTLAEAIEQTPNTQLNLMFLNMDDTAIQLWANKHQIPQQLVNTGRFNLNHGDLNFESLQIKKKTAPLLLLSKNGQSSIVDLGKF